MEWIPRMPGYSEEDEAAAFRAIDGHGLALNLDHPVSRAATIRGIRSHFAYATGAQITALCTGENGAHNLDFVRARNARLIMSNQIPTPEELNISGDEAPGDPETTRVPYCIWHPDFATEDTYRELAKRYPSMRYQVGRACAAAGLDKLYLELDLLPDVCMAEEARESKTLGGTRIYEAIMSAPSRYAVMNDYNRSISISDAMHPAFLNGDTNVLRTLEYFPFAPLRIQDGSDRMRTDPVMCITETKCICTHSDDNDVTVLLSHEEIQLLYTPLPADLPTINKTLLIHMAAYNGDVDRYARLVRSPLYLSDVEAACVVRGIYCHPMFARWWALQLNGATQFIARANSVQRDEIQRAISARRIMSNDRHEFEHGWDASKPQPFLIWWPQRPARRMLSDLWHAAPTMRETAIVASIMCDYEYNLWVDYTPTDAIYLAARENGNPVYLERVLAKAKEMGIDVTSTYGEDDRPPCYERDACIMKDLDPSEDHSFNGRRPDGVAYDGYGAMLNSARPTLWDLHKLIWHVPLGLDEWPY